MSIPRHDGLRPVDGRPGVRPELVFPTRLGGPIVLPPRAMLAYVFVVGDAGALADRAGTVVGVQTNGVDPRRRLARTRNLKVA